ncbi:helix-turn-helix domain-containing protein [Mangrovibacillus cuniculi]|uniref:Helix-turn-helix transcriptional regulator n=1 Tax=Mangrovibacillus cuniculi TaxID=2593652 RepID=A0A7S8CEL5_9BACI|nr:helix-turn-helix transcriptional regulator [Mangrovibacillus cuniculi]QPC47142.1 helix-turn-helix transcriptional regulator [Mangrovibacillus cuniculi]QPC48507.1 helix-turn-helix transcriptional regulator [Mangrovibacillus cuniculi]
MDKRNRQPYNKIKAYLVEKNIKHRDVAKLLSIQPNTVSKKLNGFGGDFSLEDAWQMHNELGVPIAYFFEPSVPKKEHRMIS